MNIKFKWMMPFWALMLLSVASYAKVFNIVPQVALPTSVPQGSSVKAYYTVTNTTGRFHASNYIKSLPPNVTQVVTDNMVPNLCGVTFPLAAQASCTLELNITGAVNAHDPNPKDHLFACLGGCITCCAGTNFPLNVSVLTPTSIAITPINNTINVSGAQQYIAIGSYANNSTADITAAVRWNSSNNLIATIANGGLATGQSPGSTAITAQFNSLTSNSANLTVVTPFSRAYLTNLSGTDGEATPSAGTAYVYSCAVEANGALNNCTSAEGGDNFNQPDGIAISNTHAYIANYGSTTVTSCTVTAGILSACSESTGFYNPEGVTLNTTGSSLYVANYNASNVLYCPVSNLGSCTTAWQGTNASGPHQVIFNSSETKAYISDVSLSAIFFCPAVTAGNLGTCVDSGIGVGTILYSQEGIALNAAANLMYISNSGNGTVLLCSINSDGTISQNNCAATGGNFNYPTGIVLSPNGQQAYVLDSGVGIVYLCSVNQPGGATPLGGLSGCTNAYPADTSFNFGQPYGMVFH